MPNAISLSLSHTHIRIQAYTQTHKYTQALCELKNSLLHRLGTFWNTRLSPSSPSCICNCFCLGPDHSGYLDFSQRALLIHGRTMVGWRDDAVTVLEQKSIWSHFRLSLILFLYFVHDAFPKATQLPHIYLIYQLTDLKTSPHLPVVTSSPGRN